MNSFKIFNLDAFPEYSFKIFSLDAFPEYSRIFRSTIRAPVFGRSQNSAPPSITEKRMEVYYLDECIVIKMDIAGFPHQAIF